MTGPREDTTAPTSDATEAPEGEGRVCPKCEEIRPRSAFKSSHPRTHCDVCHGDVTDGQGEVAPAGPEAPTWRGEIVALENGHFEVVLDGQDSEGIPFELKGTFETRELAELNLEEFRERARQLESGEVATRRRRRERRAASRRRRLERRTGVSLDRCPLLDIELDAGPRSEPMHRPVRVDDGWVSKRAAAILATGVTADELELLALHLHDRDQES